jgi:hypothetical protein
MMMSLRCILPILLAAASVAQAPPARSVGFRIAGTAVNAMTGQPMPQTQLSIARAQTPGILQTVPADDNGRFEFQVAEAGKYVLIGQARGFGMQTLDEHGAFSSAAVVGPGIDSEHILFALRPDAYISGLITDDANEPVRDADVMLFRRGIDDGRVATSMRVSKSTDDQGRYHFGHLPPGTYYVVVSAHPWYAEFDSANLKASADNDQSRDVTYPITYYSGATESSAATPIALRPGDHATADVALLPIPALRARITGVGQSPEEMPGIFVTQQVFGNVIGVQAQNQRLPNGEVYMVGLPPGQMTLNIEAQGAVPVSIQQPLNITGNNEVEIKAGGALRVTGTVTLDGLPTSAANVALTNNRTGERFDAMSTTKGEFQIINGTLKPGMYEVAVYNVDKAVVGNISAVGAKVAGRSVEIPGSDPVQLSIALTKGLGRIDGTAIRDSKPMAGAMILLVPKKLENNLSLVRRDQSDSDGTFTLPEILPGQYLVLALQNAWDLEWQNPAVLKPYLKSADTLSVTPNQRSRIKINVQ